MSKTGAMSNTLRILELTTSQSTQASEKCVYHICYLLVPLCLTYCLEEHHGWMLRSSKSRKQSSRQRSRSMRRDLYEGSKLLEQTRKQVRLHSPSLAYRRRYMFEAILPRDVHESALYTRFTVGDSQSWTTLDKLFAIFSCFEAPKRYLSPFHRRRLWLKLHPTRIPWRLHDSAIDSSEARERPSRSHTAGATALQAEMVLGSRLLSDILPCGRTRFPAYHYSLRLIRGTISNLP